MYAKYYYDLRTLAIANDIQLPLQPLYRERAKKLEVCRWSLRVYLLSVQALSRHYEDKLLPEVNQLKRSHSAERLKTNRAPCIIP